MMGAIEPGFEISENSINIRKAFMGLLRGTHAKQLMNVVIEYSVREALAAVRPYATMCFNVLN